MKSNTILYLVAGILGLLLIVSSVYLFVPGGYLNVGNFEQCKKEGFETTKSIPSICTDFWGKEHTEEESDLPDSTAINQTLNINSYKDCEEAGFELSDTYPRECITNTGQSYTEDLGNVEEVSEEILLYSPYPNEIVNSLDFEIKGLANGNWFDNDKLNYVIRSSELAELDNGFCLAKEEVTSTAKYEFSCPISFDKGEFEEAELIIYNSDSREEDEDKKNLTMPIIIYPFVEDELGEDLE